MFSTMEIVNRILESDDYMTVLAEVKNYYVNTFEEFVNQLKAFDARIKKLGIKTEFAADNNAKMLTWLIKRGYMSSPQQELGVLSFEDGGTVQCDKKVKFACPGSTNLNNLVDANQILKLIAGYVYSLERDKSNEKEDETDKEEEFKLDPSIVQILDKLKSQGESLLSRVKSMPAVNFNGKDYKVSDGELMASTEQDLVLALNFPKDQERDIYSSEKVGQKLRRTLINSFKKNGFNPVPEFRMDMDQEPYLYFSVGKLPVKKLNGPEAEAILNYYDGKKVRFQPRD